MQRLIGSTNVAQQCGNDVVLHLHRERVHVNTPIPCPGCWPEPSHRGVVRDVA